MCVVLANGYAGTLFSFLSVTKLQKPINSVKELADAMISKDIRLLIQGQTILADRFLVITIQFINIQKKMNNSYLIVTIV
jgi:hypothetical protein